MLRRRTRFTDKHRNLEGTKVSLELHSHTGKVSSSAGSEWRGERTVGPDTAEMRLWGTPWGEAGPQRSGVWCI